MRQHAANAERIVGFLRDHPRVGRVIYPGLADHPQYDLARQQMTGFGGMISAELLADQEAVCAALSRCRVFSLAESLGGVESLIEHPGIMTHASVPPEIRASLGITDGLIRLSVGLEDSADLIADLDQALATLN
jgi:cystathionine beta-lyase/cystathionine gamma-synthase